MSKAEELAKLLNDKDFVRTTGWIDRFKLRHICCGKVSGAARAVSCETAAEWLNKVRPEVREGYSDSDIFKADETGIFFRLTPDKTLKFKVDKCAGRKLSKYRITVLCANSNGTEKRQLFVIGKSNSPRYFKNVKCLPVRYRANTKSLMTSDLFESELRLWDQQLPLQNRKLLLLVDKCPAHSELDNLQNI
jgi:hypothetical protein